MIRRVCLQILLAVVFGTALGVTPPGGSRAYAQGLTETGEKLRGDRDETIELDGYFRGRGTGLYNLDLDRGPTPSGQYLYPLPLSNPASPWLTHADMRLRTDLSVYPQNSQVGVHLRVDVLDNLAFGDTPRHTPLTTTSQRPPGLEDALRIKRAYGQALTPFGLLAIGRMGAHWGLGMLANSGDCRDCNSGDAADRIAFMTPIADHLWALAYDLAYRGPTVDHARRGRSLDLDPADEVRTLTFAVSKYRRKWVRDRRRKAGRATVDYGAYVSHRWQRRDVPSEYVETEDDPQLDPSQSIHRGFQALAIDWWVRWVHPYVRFELEAAYLGARIEEPSLVPGVRLDEPLTSRQFGAAMETDFGHWKSRLKGGLDAGFASGDEAPGFGASPGYRGERGEPGDLRGAQASPPEDLQANNFTFHPDYRIDQILFHEIIGTVTDAAYLRPHVQWLVADMGPSSVEASVAAPISWAVMEESTPGGESPLGLEIDPSIGYRNERGFQLVFDYGVLFPFAGLHARDESVGASPAQLLKLTALYEF